MNIGQFLNHNSYAISAAVFLVFIGAEIVRREITPRSLGILALFAVALVAPVLWLRAPGSGAPEVDAALASGRPVLLEVYSDF